MSQPYTNEQIRAIYDLMIPIGQQATLIPLEAAEAVLEAFHLVDSVLPMVDPTAWMKLQRTAPANIAYARAFLAFRRAIEQLRLEAER